MRKKIMLACLCIILVCLVLLATDKRPRMERPREEPGGAPRGCCPSRRR